MADAYTVLGPRLHILAGICVRTVVCTKMVSYPYPKMAVARE